MITYFYYGLFRVCFLIFFWVWASVSSADEQITFDIIHNENAF